MSTHAKDGREWAKLSALEVGDKLECDGDFTCGIAHTILTVQRNDDGKLYVACDEGEHLLEGQCNDLNEDEPNTDHLIGMWSVF